MKTFLLLTVLAFLVLLQVPALAEDGEFKAQAGEDGVQKVQITAASYSFTPRYIIVKMNQPVELSVKKEGGLVPHNITLNAPEAGIDFSESLGAEPTAIKFTPTKAGKYTFFCSNKAPFSKSHREKGMEGVLEVRE